MLLKAKNRLAHVPSSSLNYDDRIVMTASKNMTKKQQVLQDELKVVLKAKSKSKISDKPVARTNSLSTQKPKNSTQLKKTQSLMATMRDNVNNKIPYQRHRHFRSFSQRNKRSSLPAVLNKKQPPTKRF